MTHILFLDPEQRDLLQASAEMAHAALDARARRVDPDGIISKSVGMSRIKVQNALAQLDLPPMVSWRGMSPDLRIAALETMKALLANPNGDLADAYWNGLQALVIQRDRSAPGDETPLEDAANRVRHVPMEEAQTGTQKP